MLCFSKYMDNSVESQMFCFGKSKRRGLVCVSGSRRGVGDKVGVLVRMVCVEKSVFPEFASVDIVFLSVGGEVFGGAFEGDVAGAVAGGTNGGAGDVGVDVG